MCADGHDPVQRDDPPCALLAQLQEVGFSESERAAVAQTPAMRRQLRQFAERGGRIERVDADFSGANGMPGLIRFYCPRPPAPPIHAHYGTLAHELGHALFCPEQWAPPEHFADAQAYARARELGEAHAWLNQYRLHAAKRGGDPEAAPVLSVENDGDFGTQAVDVFARIAECASAGWSESQILDELAMLNANMFPCGMGEGNLKTYGQCNRWDWLRAHEHSAPAFRQFLHALGRVPNVNEQKVVTKFNLFTPHSPAPTDALHALARCFRAEPQARADVLYALARSLLPGCQPGVLTCGRDTAPGLL